MRQVVSDVQLIEGLRGANVYLLPSNEGLTLVDSGMAGNADRIIGQIEEAGYRLSQLHTIVLTHAHADHARSAAELARRSGAAVVAHQDEAPYIKQTEPMPAASPAQRLMNWLGERFMFRSSPCQVDRLVGDGDLVEALGGMRVIHMPGHTPGSMALYQPERQILFCGDALFNANPLTGRPGLRFPLALATVDRAQARASVGKLSALPIEVLCCGHGEPIVGGAGEQICALLGVESA